MAAQAQLYTSSAIINGQLVPSARSNNYYPFAIGPVIQGVPAGPPQSQGSGYTGSSVNPNSAVSAVAAQNPFSFTLSPVPMLIIMFVAGFLLLRYVHYRY